MAGLLVAADPAIAQPAVEADLASFRSARADQARLEMHLQVPHASLRFVSREEAFRAGYVIGATIYRADRNDRPDGLVMMRSWTRRVHVDSYEGTLDWQAYDHSTHAVELPPGRYVVRLRVEDSVSGRAATHEAVTEVRDLAVPSAVSDLLVVDSYDASNGRYTANPGRRVVSDASLALYYEVYLGRPERLRVEYVVREATTQQRRGGILGFLFGRGERPGATVFQVVEPMALAAGTRPVHRRLPAERFGPGEYEVTVRVEHEDDGLIAERVTNFTIGWEGLIEGVDDLDSAIAQLRYIAKDREIRAMLQAPTQEEKFRLFREFWDRRDPSPGSFRNERMEEYYSRVGHAVSQYGRTGWESDRGEVFIRFGQPDRVEDHSEAQGSRPHQVWYYHRMGRRFIFVEDSGDFRLMVPIWDERTRM